MMGSNSEFRIPNSEFTCRAGSDESGKGDYFGPLVVAAFVCDSSKAAHLQKIGVQDSKKVTDKKINEIAERLLTEFKGDYQYLVLKPEKYNELYKKFSVKKPGLNEMLAWMHSKVIGDLYERSPFDYVLIDKFAKDEVIKGFLYKNSKLKSEQIMIQTQAESDIVVAGASIIARYLYIKNLDELSEKYGIKLLKGASRQVQALRRQIPADIQPMLVKMHFK